MCGVRVVGGRFGDGLGEVGVMVLVVLSVHS